MFPFGMLLGQSIPVWTPSELRWELAGAAIGIILLATGVAGITLFLFRKANRDFTLLYFSLFALLYAVRLLFRQSIVRSLFPIPASVWDHLDLVIDCVIAIPLTLFLIQLVEPLWKRILRGLVVVQLLFGATRLGSHVLDMGQKAMATANNIFIIGSCLLLAFYYLSLGRAKGVPREIKVAFGGLAAFAVLVVQGNLLDLGILPGPRNLEPLGFLIFLCCLGYVAGGRALAGEERLLAIGKELEIANRIQASILPRDLPAIPGLEIAARYLPMSAVAGDFYDFVVWDQRRLGVLVADVTGHGVPAALIASMLKVAFAAQSPHADRPAFVLQGINASLCGRFDQHFVTAGYAFFDLEKGILRYGSAGHPPLILASRGGDASSLRPREVREVEANGYMLGLFPEGNYPSLELPLQAGDRIVLYTDGVTESMNAADEEFGPSRLKAFVAASSFSAARLADGLLLELRRWSGAEAGQLQGDDITLLVVDVG